MHDQRLTTGHSSRLSLFVALFIYLLATSSTSIPCLIHLTISTKFTTVKTIQEAQLSQRNRALFRVIQFHSRSFEMTPSSTACIRLSVKYWHDLQICVRHRSRSLKMVPFESLGKVSYLHSIVTVAESCIVSEIGL